MKTNGYLVLIFSILVFCGGVMGYIKSGSLPSIISGGAFGALLLASSSMIIKGKKNGQKIALIGTLALDAFFTYRFAANPKFMPAGLMIILCNLMLISLITGIRKKANTPSS
jgi:uncharacterized membrane protein (UPF0136 family)